MLTHRLALIVVLVVLLAPSRGYPQDPPKTGLVTGYPGSIGLIFEASENTAVRPEFSFSGSSTDGNTGLNKNNRFAGGASVLFYLRRVDNLRLYVSPRLSYSRSHSTSEYGTGQVSSNTATTWQPAGMFGAQYSLHRRFAVYGEAGAGYARSTNKGEAATSMGFTIPTKQTGHGWSNMSAVGVIVYF